MEPLLLSPEYLQKKRALMARIFPILKEAHFRRHHPFYKYIPDDHEEGNQEAFHRSPAQGRIVLGGAQSGKSRAAAQEVAWWLDESHPYLVTPKAPRIYVISSHYRTVQEGVWKHLWKILPRWRVLRWGPTVQPWLFRAYAQMVTGGQADFISAEGGEDARRKLEAAEADLVVVDEEIDEAAWQATQRRRLARGGKYIITTTPYRSDPWLLDLEDAARTGSDEIKLWEFSTYRARDRGHVKASVVAEMEATLSPEEREVTLKGKSRRRQGLVFPEFGEKHSIDPFVIPDDWTRYNCIDPGFRTCAVLYAAVAPDGKYVLYRALYLHETYIHKVIHAILASEGYAQDLGEHTWHEVPFQTERIYQRWIDRSAFGHHETGELKYGSLLGTISEELGLGATLAAAPAPNDFDVGLNLCHHSLELDLDGLPRCRVFKSCEPFFREIRHYRFKRDPGGANRPEPKDKPIPKGDHLMACWRYLELTALPYVPPNEVMRKTKYADMPFVFATSTEDRMKEHLEALGITTEKPDRPEHPGGLGTEY